MEVSRKHCVIQVLLINEGHPIAVNEKTYMLEGNKAYRKSKEDMKLAANEAWKRKYRRKTKPNTYASGESLTSSNKPTRRLTNILVLSTSISKKGIPPGCKLNFRDVVSPLLLWKPWRLLLFDSISSLIAFGHSSRSLYKRSPS